MAASTKAELIESLTKMGVQLTGDEKVDDLKVLIAQHAEQSDQDPRKDGSEEESQDSQNDHNAPPVDNEHVAPGASKFDQATVEANSPKGDVTRVVFHLNDKVIRSREFSEAVHGPEFLSIASDFEKSNAKRIVRREDL